MSEHYIVESDEEQEMEVDQTGTGDRALTVGKGRMGGETPYSPFTDARLLPYPETANCIMPFTYYTTAALNSSSPGPADYCAAITWRLNSITDCITGATYTEDPVKAADTIDGTPNRPMMFDFWSAIYQYWSVVGSKYTITVYDTDRTNVSQSSIWLYHHGQQSPPFFNASSGKVPDYIRQLHPNMRMKILNGEPSASGHPDVNTGVTFTGVYAPGPKYVHNSVVEDELNKRWHKTTETPPLHEKASLFLQRSDLQDTIALKAMSWRIRIQINYLVQWKDIRTKYKYPSDTTDFPAVTDPYKKTN